MTNIVERLRDLAPVTNAETRATMTEAAAEITRLRAGGCARDQGTTQYCAEAAKLAAEVERLLAGQYDVYAAAREEYRTKIAEQATENERLRAALRKLIGACYEGRIVQKSAGGMTIEAQTRNSVINGVSAWAVAEAEEELDRAALEEGRT